MARRNDRESVEWRSHYEACEDRLVLSAQPLAPSALLPQADATPTTQYGALAPDANELKELTADLEYVRRTYGLRGEGQTVAIIDSGIAYDHVALGGGYGPGYRVVGGWDFTEENDANPYDDPPAGFHGTHVAGIIGSSDPTHPGVAPSVDIVALRVFDDQGYGRLEWLEDALQWVHANRNAFAHPITTVNLSLATKLDATHTAPRDMLEDDLAQLEADGIFVAVAAGNAFQQADIHGLSYPASSTHVVPVGSVDPDGQLSSFSQRDPRVLLASGQHVTSTVPGFLFGGGGVSNDFAYANGTSMATPYVAGSAVLVREAMQDMGRTGITEDEIESHLRATADSVYDRVTDQSYLRINLARAIDALEAGRSSSLAADFITPTDAGIRVAGTPGDDTLELRFTDNGARLVVNGKTYDFPSSAARTVLVHGGGGFDQATLNDSPGDDTLRAFPDHVELVTPYGTARLEGFARVTVRATAGGNDTAEMHDSPAADRFQAWPDAASMAGIGYQIRAEGFHRVHAYAEAGGEDVASLYDSSGNDRFYGDTTYVTLAGQGYYRYARGFSKVYVQATVGGDDQAQLYDSPGADRFVGRATTASLSAVGYYCEVNGFDHVTANSVSGGTDQASFFDSVSDDRFRADPTTATMTGIGYINEARGFARVQAFSDRGHDEATLYGSFRDEAVGLWPSRTELTGARFAIQTQNFQAVRVHGDGGADRAVFYEVGAGDAFHGQGTEATLATASVLRAVYDFDEVTLQGQRIAADLAALDYVFRQAGG